MNPDDAPRRGQIDDLLGPRRNTGPAGVLLGSVGDRLWCQGLASAPGMRGVFQYIHNGLHSALFELDLLEEGRPLLLPAMAHRWHPSHVIMEANAGALRVQERKFITRDDRAIDVVSIRNDSNEPRRLTLRLRTPLTVRDVEGALAGVGQQGGTAYGFALAAEGFAVAKERAAVHAALNAERRGAPEARASFTYSSDSVWHAVDGERVPARRWTCGSSGSASDWFEVDFGAARAVERVVLDVYEDRQGVWVPRAVHVEVDGRRVASVQPVKGANEIRFPAVEGRVIRATFDHQPGKASGLVEFEAYPGREIERSVLERTIAVRPHGQETFAAVCAFADDVVAARGKCAVRDAAAVAGAHIAEYASWFERNVPRFECPDPWFEKLWWHRWYVVRHCLAEPKTGFLREPCFFEGRHGSWYPQVITYGHALQSAEVRWLCDPRYAYGHLSAVLRNQFEGKEGFYAGMFPNVQVDRRVNFYYTDWIPRGAWDVFLVHPDRDYMAWALPRLERNVEEIVARFDPDNDYLPTVLPQNPGDAHFHTGMEWQPSFFWFSSPRAFDRETPLERVDFACALYASCRAIAEARQALGREPGEFELYARRIAAAVRDRMWDPERRFHYSVRPDTKEKALVEEIVGFYPAAFDLPGAEPAFERLFDPAQFWCAYPAHSASKKSDLYSQTAPAGCRWNGATWPFANSLVAEALASGVRRGAASRRQYFDFLERYVRAQFEEGDLARPATGEFYDSDTGAWQTGVKDYFHSTYADLLIRHVGGLVPRADDRLEFHPVVDAWDRFRFEGVPYRGMRLDIEWRRGSGLQVRRNGSALFRWPRLEHVLYDPATRRTIPLP